MPSVAIIGTRGYPSFYGGFETAVRRLAPYLAEHGWSVTVYGRTGQTIPDWPERDERVVSVVTSGIDSTSLSTLSYGFTSALHAARRRPDVALVMNVANGYFLPLLRARGVPTLVNVDGVEWERAKWGRLARTVFKTGARFTRRFATQLVVDAVAIGDYWQKTFGRDGAFIPYGADVPPPLPVEPGLVSGEYVLLVARLVPENSIGQFLEAAQELTKTRDVVVVGSPSGLEPDVLALLESLDASPRFHRLGQISDDDRLFSLWQHAGVYFHGHTVGGTNPALVQAMACGAPTVARDTVFNREVLSDAGIFVDSSPAELAVAIGNLLDDPRRQAELRKAAQSRARAVYSWESVLSSYEAQLRTIARSD